MIRILIPSLSFFTQHLSPLLLPAFVKVNLRTNFLDLTLVVIVLSFTLIASRTVLSTDFPISLLLAELKPLTLLAAVFLVGRVRTTLSPSLSQNLLERKFLETVRAYAWTFIILSLVVTLYVAAIMGGPIIRAIDYFEVKSDLVSTYQSAIACLLYILLKGNTRLRIGLLVTIGLAGSGIGYIGLISYYIFPLRLRIKNWIFITLLVIAILQTADYRGYALSEWLQNNTRTAILSAYLSSMTISTLLIGGGLTTPLKSDFIGPIRDPEIVSYILSESASGAVYSTILHSDLLRFTATYGCICLIVFLFLLSRQLKGTAVAFPTLIMGVIGGCLYSTGYILLVILTIAFHRNQI